MDSNDKKNQVLGSIISGDKKSQKSEEKDSDFKSNAELIPTESCDECKTGSSNEDTAMDSMDKKNQVLGSIISDDTKSQKHEKKDLDCKIKVEWIPAESFDECKTGSSNEDATYPSIPESELNILVEKLMQKTCLSKEISHVPLPCVNFSKDGSKTTMNVAGSSTIRIPESRNCFWNVTYSSHKQLTQDVFCTKSTNRHDFSQHKFKSKENSFPKASSFSFFVSILQGQKYLKTATVHSKDEKIKDATAVSTIPDDEKSHFILPPPKFESQLCYRMLPATRYIENCNKSFNYLTSEYCTPKQDNSVVPLFPSVLNHSFLEERKSVLEPRLNSDLISEHVSYVESKDEQGLRTSKFKLSPPECGVKVDDEDIGNIISKFDSCHSSEQKESRISEYNPSVSNPFPRQAYALHDKENLENLTSMLINSCPAYEGTKKSCSSEFNPSISRPSSPEDHIVNVDAKNAADPFFKLTPCSSNKNGKESSVCSSSLTAERQNDCFDSSVPEEPFSEPDVVIMDEDSGVTSLSSTFGKDAVGVCKAFMERDPENLNFSLMALVSGPAPETEEEDVEE